MDLDVWLNFISPDGPCFDAATLPIPGSPVALSMIDALVESYVKEPHDEIRVLEVGSFCGISALTWGRALERLGVQAYTIHCVDLWYHSGGVRYSPETVEVARTRNAFNHEIAKFNLSKSIGFSHVTEVIGDSRVALKSMRDGFFDLIYIDGYHGHQVVVHDLANAFRLCKRGGIICGDDYDCSPEMMAVIPAESREFDHYIMPPTDVGVHPGVVLAVNQLLGTPITYGGFWAFSKVSDAATPPFIDHVVPIDVGAFPRRIPDFIPVHVRPRFEAHFAGRGGLLVGHPMMAEPPCANTEEAEKVATG